MPKAYKNITVDADLVAVINKVADRLQLEFGFRPNISQTLRYLVNKEQLP